MRNRALILSVLALPLLLAFGVQAAPPQSDDWSAGKPAAFWTFEQVGETNGLGEITKVEKGKLTMTASGADIWGSADGMSFLYQKVTGDFQVTLQVLGGLEAPPSDTYAKAGLMIRGSNDPSAAYLYLFESPFRFGVGWEGRRTDGIGADFAENPSQLRPPVYLRLVRIGRVVTPYVSADGKIFVQAGSSRGPADFPGLDKDEVLVGLAQTAHNANPDMLCTADYGPFTAVALGTDPTDKTPPPAIADLSVNVTGPNSVSLSWSAVGGDAFVYQARRSYVPITEANWSATTPVGAPDPSPAGAKETVDVTGLDALQTYYFAVRTLDVNGNLSALSNVVVATTAYSPPGPLREVYTGISGTSLDNLRDSPKFPNNPDQVQFLAGFEAPTNVMDNYGQRVRGYFVPPVTGDYVFTIAGDDNCELWLSSDETPAKAEVIATVNTWTNPREWGKEENQTSSPIRLQAGKKYYIEALMKEGGGGDNLAVKVMLPDGTEQIPIMPPNIIPPVPAEFGRVRGTVLDASGKPVAGVAVTLKSAAMTLSVTTDANGFYTMYMPEGETEVTAVLGAAPLDKYSAAAKVMVKAREAVTADLALPASLITMSLRAADLKAAGKPGWRLLSTLPDDVGVFEGMAPDYADYIKPTYKDTGVDSLIPTSTWVEDWPLVPGDAGPAGRAGQPGGIPDNTYWVQRLHFTLPPEMEGAEAFILRDFNTDDINEITAINGVKIGGEPGVWQWDRNWVIAFTKDVVLFGGKENVLAIVGYEGGGGAGHNIDYGGPRLIAVVPGAIAPPVVPGDVNGDGKVGIPDATLALQMAVGIIKPTPAQLAGGDLNKNGRIEIAEVTQILQAAVGLRKLS